MNLPNFSREEEKLHCVTHAIAAFISAIASIFLLSKGIMIGNVPLLIGYFLFSTSVTFTFLSSAAYHGVIRNKDLKMKLRLMDHMAIYIMIAGSYSPFCLTNFYDKGGLYILGLIWVMAILGCTFKILIRNHLDRLVIFDSIFYLFMGSIVLLFYPLLLENIDPVGLQFLAIGGALYIIGTLTYLTKAIPYNHVVWHLFAMSAAACHFYAVAFYTKPYLY